MISLKFKDTFADNLAGEFENIVAQIKGFFLAEHNEDGTHRAPEELTNTVPTGTVVMHAGTVAPSHWLLCDGSAVNRVQYQDLFEEIGITFGVGDGTTTFNVPNVQSRFPLGAVGAGVGITGGTSTHDHTGSVTIADHTHSGGSLLAASHTHSAGTLNADGHTHSISTQADHGHDVTGTTDSEGSHRHGINGTTNGEGGYYEVISDPGDPSAVEVSAHQHTHGMSFMSDAGESHSHGAGSLETSNNGSHNHTGSTGSNDANVSGSTGSNDAAVSGTTGSGGASSPSFTTATASHVPSYITFNYIIKV
jgi:microcystin-dependent protein